MGCCASGSKEGDVAALRPSSSGGSASSTRRRDYGSGSLPVGSSSSSLGHRSSTDEGRGRRSLGSGKAAGGDYRPSASLSQERPTDRTVHAVSPTPGPFENLLVHCPERYWVKDEEAPTCGYCGDDFTLTNRRHHCRLCGDIFHGGECCQKAGTFELWVCAFCYAYHTEYKDKLQHGAVMTKYTRDLERSHQRHFWLSSDGRELIWKEVESRSRLSNLTGSNSNVHNLRLAEVTRVQPTGPPGLESYGHSFAFQVVTGERPYVLEAANVKDYSTWTEGLKCAVYVSQAHQTLQGRQLEDRARRHAKGSRDNHRQLIADRVRARQKRMKKSG